VRGLSTCDHSLAWQVMKDFVQLKQIEDVLDKGLAVKHSKLSQLTEEVITDPSKVGVRCEVWG